MRALRNGKSYRIARDVGRISMAMEYHASQGHLEKFVKDTINQVSQCNEE